MNWSWFTSDVSPWWFSFGFAFVSVPAWAYLWCKVWNVRRRGFWDWVLLLCIWGTVINTVLLHWEHDDIWNIAAYGVWFLIWLWHRWRDKRKRAAAWLGAKSRALREALVRKVRESMQPRPVLRPVPQRGGW